MVEQQWLPVLIIVLVLAFLAVPLLLIRKTINAAKAFRLKAAEKKAAKAALAIAAKEKEKAALESGTAGALDSPQDRVSLENGSLDPRDTKADMKRLRDQLAQEAADRDRLTMEAIQSLRPGEVQVSRLDILQKFLSEEVEKEPERMAHIVRVWLRESE